MLPFVFFIAIGIMFLVFTVLAGIRGETLRQLLKSDDHWLLIVMFPAIFFGFTAGFILMNLILYFSPLKEVFEKESDESGRPDFHSATYTLARAGAVLFALTILAMIIFLLVTRN